MEEYISLNEQREEYEKRFNEFVSLAVHDLDSPLRKLGVFIEKLTDSITNGNDTAIYINRINACLAEMRSLISSLAELDAVVHSKRYVSCNMAAIVQDVLKELEQVINDKNATISCSTLPLVQGIHDQYHLLFKKLLENSLKFTKNGAAVSVYISAEKIGESEMKKMKLEENKSWHRIIISDNGIGFSQEDAEKIFEPFARLHGKSAFPGQGLGLTIARKIIENHKGRIFAEGDENGGSRFLLVIPENP
jgi:signal transduction histidine kinase